MTRASTYWIIPAIAVLVVACNSSPTTVLKPTRPLESDLRRFTKAEVFYVPWRSTFYIPTTPADVRDHPAAHLILTNSSDASLLAYWAGVDDLPTVTPVPIQDVRVVLDFTNAAGTIESFYATSSLLLNHDGSKARAIDEAFRRTICEGLMFQNVIVGASCA